MIKYRPSFCALSGLLLLVGSAAAQIDAGPAPVDVAFDGASYALSVPGVGTFHETTAVVVGARAIAVPGSATRLVLWTEQAADGTQTPYYAITEDGLRMARVTPTSYVIHHRHGDFDPLRGVPAPKGGLAANGDCELYLVQFVTQPLGEFRAAVTALGGTIHGYIVNHTFIVRMAPETRQAVAALPYVRWVGPLHPAYRVEELMRDNMARGEELFPWQRYNIQVCEAGWAQKAAVGERIKALGGVVNQGDAGKYLLEATLTPAQLREVISWNEVLFVDRWSPLQPDMNNAREYGGANYVETVGNFKGQGVRGEVFDAGFNLGHVDFQSRPLIEHGGPAGSDSHGASTSGIVFGDGTGNALARGMLPLGQGIVANYNNVGLYGTNRRNHTAQLLQSPYYAVFQTCSVGSDRTTQYTTISADMDSMLFDLDFAICQSQSNAGNQDSRPQAWAKNIISVGALYHYDTLSALDDCWCGGASIGPASDGRIKPDLCAYYDSTFTVTSGSSTAYTSSFGGTSGATPIVAGHLGLFYQMWSVGTFGNEVDPDGTVFSNRCHMTTAKAMLINTATQYPFSGTSHDKTRVHQGWGWPSVSRLYDMREKFFIVDESEVLSNMQSVQYPLTVVEGEPRFQATLVYADPPGTPGSSQHRINDLTLKVTAPGGTVYWGNFGLTAGNYSSPGGSANTKDTVENVIIQNPASGSWLVEVIASEVVQDGHVETPELDADFALVVSGVIPCSSSGVLSLDRSAYACTAMAALRVIDCDLNTDPNSVETVNVTVTSTSEPAGEVVVLTETGAQTAVFTGAVPFSTTDGAGVLWVADGDTVTAEYLDADDGQGGQNVLVTDTATMDCVAPAISNVATTDISSSSAKVRFDASEPVQTTVFYGTLCAALTNQVTTSTFEVAPVVDLTGLSQNKRYFYAIQVVDSVGNVTVDDNGGSCYTFRTNIGPQAVYSFPLDTSPGWTISGGQWAFGHPTGGGGEYGPNDPNNGYTGTNVYGYNLSGDYANNIPEYHLTTTALNCSNLTEVSLRFWRWLGVEQPVYDHAYVRASNNGTTWTTIWSNPTEIGDTSWTYVQYDISAVANNKPNVYVRWTMGTTDSGWRYCGWNIDDVEIWGTLPVTITVGDLNCDGEVNFGDINPFVLILTDLIEWEAAYPTCPSLNGDISGNGAVGFEDINPFVQLLAGGI